MTEVTVTAQVLLRDVTLLVDKVHPHATVDRGLVTLLPGESATFRVRGAHGIPAERFSDPAVLRSANQLVTPRGSRRRQRRKGTSRSSRPRSLSSARSGISSSIQPLCLMPQNDAWSGP